MWTLRRQKVRPLFHAGVTCSRVEASFSTTAAASNSNYFGDAALLSWLAQLLPGNGQPTLWSTFVGHTNLLRTTSRPPRSARFSNGHTDLENALVVDVDDPSTVGREMGTTQQTSLLAHT